MENAEPLLKKLAGHDSDWVFPSPSLPERHLHPSTVCLYFQRASAAAGIPRLTNHCLRHTGATRLLRSGADVRTVQDILGHATAEMTLRYCKVCPTRSLEAVEALSRWGQPNA